MGCQIQDCYLSFLFEVDEARERPRIADFQVRVDGLLQVAGSLVELQDHWRVDAEEEAPPQRDQRGRLRVAEGREPHPSFHFQRGGHAQDAFAAQHGFFPAGYPSYENGPLKGLMQYPGPRIPILPFDPTLAIDFCIAQNDGLIWRRLREIPEYFNIVEIAHKRMWQPFLESPSDRAARRKWLGPVIVV